MAVLTLAEAEKILAAAKAKVLEMGKPMGVSVVDPRGDLITMFRADGAKWRTAPISRGKAAASAAFGVPSRELLENAQNPVQRALMAIEGGHLVPGPGAYPIYRNGELIGAAGGSGGSAEEDEAACMAGINALGLSIKP